MAQSKKIPCLACGRMVRDNPDAKARHIVEYHPMAPIKRIAGMFNPQLFEFLGYRIGQKLKALI